MPASSLPSPRHDAVAARLSDLTDVTDALDCIEVLALGETPSREEIAALLRLICEAVGTRLHAAERAMGRPTSE